MSYSKRTRTVAAIIGIAGFFLMMGGAGKSDLMTELGIYYPLWKTALQMGIGVAMMGISAIVFKDYDLEDDEDWEDWEDEIYED